MKKRILIAAITTIAIGPAVALAAGQSYLNGTVQVNIGSSPYQQQYQPVLTSQYSGNYIPTGSTPHPRTLADLASYIVAYLNLALDLMMAFAVVMFVWYVIQYFIKPNEDRKNAGLYVMYSVIGFFVILSIWGIVNILGNTFGLGNQYNSYQSWSSFTSIFPR